MISLELRCGPSGRAIGSDPKDICPYLPLAMLERGAGDWNALVEVTDRMLRLDSIDYLLAHVLNAAESVGVFQALGPGTGGKTYLHTATDSMLPNILKSLAKEVLPYTYVAGYYPSTSDD